MLKWNMGTVYFLVWLLWDILHLEYLVSNVRMTDELEGICREATHIMAESWY
jgi:hypothetical protein